MILFVLFILIVVITMSIWETDVKIPSFQKINKNKKVDILIIGGGLSGIHTLYKFKEEKSICLVEANTIGCGVTKNTTGKLTYLQENTLGYLIKKGKQKEAKLYLKSQIEGIQEYLKIIKEEQIDCNLEKVSSYLVTNQEKYLSDLEQIEEFLKNEGILVKRGIPENTLPFLAGISVLDTYVFHPLKYMEGILKKIQPESIYENTRVVNITKNNDIYECITKEGYTIFAKKVIVACHYPFFLFPYFLPIKTSIEKSYIIAKQVNANLKYSYITMESPSMSSRFYQNKDKMYQLILGKSHSTSVSQNDKQNFHEVKQENQIEEDSIICSWSNVDIKTFDHMPLVGELKDNLYIITGFETWGLIQSLVSANIIKDLLDGKPSLLSDLFSPKRSFLKKILCSPFYLTLNGYSFLKSKFYKKNWYSNQLEFYRKDGKLLAAFHDEAGAHVVHPVCPHMKCGLIFNEKEKTWDCPCHSSKFDIDGNVLKGPSKKSISYFDE